MSNDFQVLQEKFQNFKKFMTEISTSPKIQLMKQYTDMQFLAFSVILSKAKSDNKLNEFVDKTCEELEIKSEHKDKLLRYYLCFCEYLEKIQAANKASLVSTN
jgi:hypothetical protein